MLTALRSHRASVALEAAITLPVALLVLIAIINFGMVEFSRQMLANAVNYGARVGSTTQGCRSCAAVSAAYQKLEGTPLRNANVDILAPGGYVGDTLKIRASGDVPNLFGGLMALFGGHNTESFHVTADAVFRAEGW
jgi:hypothetical protein